MSDDFPERLRRAADGADPWTTELVNELWVAIGWKFWKLREDQNYVHTAEDANQIAQTAAIAAVRAFSQHNPDGVSLKGFVLPRMKRALCNDRKWRARQARRHKEYKKFQKDSYFTGRRWIPTVEIDDRNDKDDGKRI